MKWDEFSKCTVWQTSSFLYKCQIWFVLKKSHPAVRKRHKKSQGSTESHLGAQSLIAKMPLKTVLGIFSTSKSSIFFCTSEQWRTDLNTHNYAGNFALGHKMEF